MLEVGREPCPGLKLLQLRGRGGFAEVWEAADKDRRRLAVKFMASQNTTSSVSEMKIIQAIQKLDHPNLLKIESVFSVPGYIVVSMELADGSLLDLFDIYHTEFKRALPPELALNYIRQAASALDYLNARKHQYDGRKVSFQHRDIKPSNLLICGETIKVADFGLCLPVSGPNERCNRCGTIDFAAPETHRGITTDSSDQYSLAMSYFYLRTGGFPFPPPPVNFTREYSYQRPAPDLGRLRPGEQRVLARALELDPVHRWPNCSAFCNALGNVLTTRGCDDTPLQLPRTEICDPPTRRGVVTSRPAPGDINPPS